MKILHLSPEYFSQDSVIGGGTRYPLELAKAMVQKKGVKVRLVAFAKGARRELVAGLKIKIYRSYTFSFGKNNPFSLAIFKDLIWADVIHCYQLRCFLTSVVVILGRLLGKKVFVTDLGGVEKNLIKKFNLLNWFNGFICISEFSALDFSQFKNKVRVIYGGVDVKKFVPKNSCHKVGVLFVSRIMPHKGLDYLIEALPSSVDLTAVGQIYDQEYYQYCQKLAQGKKVRFAHSVSDVELIKLYQKSAVLVVPSVLVDCHGKKHPRSELLGIPPLEAAACGTPTVATKITSLPEVIADRETGFLVEPNSPSALWEKIEFLLDNPKEAEKMGRAGREMVLKKFTWERAAEKCLEEYFKVVAAYK